MLTDSWSMPISWVLLDYQSRHAVPFVILHINLSSSFSMLPCQNCQHHKMHLVQSVQTLFILCFACSWMALKGIDQSIQFFIVFFWLEMCRYVYEITHIFTQRLPNLWGTLNSKQAMNARTSSLLKLCSNEVSYDLPKRSFRDINTSLRKRLTRNSKCLAPVTGLLRIHKHFLCQSMFKISSSDRTWPCCWAITWIVSGHFKSAALNEQNHVGMSSCLTIALRPCKVFSQKG